MEKTKPTLVIQVPDKRAPGFLRRQRRALQFQSAIRSGELTLEIFDELIAFLVDFVEEPKDRNAAREILLDGSQEDFEAFLDEIKGVNTEAVPLSSNDDSEDS